MSCSRLLGVAVTAVIMACGFLQAGLAAEDSAQLQHYANTEYGISFDYPQGWVTFSADDAVAGQGIVASGFVVGLAKDSSDLATRVSVTVETGGPDSFTEEEYMNYAEMLDNASGGMMVNFQKISDSVITAAGVTALEYIFTYDPQLGKGLDQIRQISVVKNGKAVTLSCGAPPQTFDQVSKDVFDVIIASLNVE